MTHTIPTARDRLLCFLLHSRRRVSDTLVQCETAGCGQLIASARLTRPLRRLGKAIYAASRWLLSASPESVARARKIEKARRLKAAQGEIRR